MGNPRLAIGTKRGTWTLVGHEPGRKYRLTCIHGTVKVVSRHAFIHSACTCGGRPCAGRVGGVVAGMTLVGRLRPERLDGSRAPWWMVVCPCGSLSVRRYGDLTKSKKSTCGRCPHIDRNVHRHPLYGNVTVEYRCWSGIKSRCLNPNVEAFRNYGGRGIGICDEWNDSFDRFYESMGPRPGDAYSIDRIDVDGDYEPSNCRWATWGEQARNKRKQKEAKIGNAVSATAESA